MTQRKDHLRNILLKLTELKKNTAWNNHLYAINENIFFFESVHSIFRYIKWLFFRGLKLDGQKLKELTDFPFPEYEEDMHLKLIEMERKNFPGLIKPLKRRILSFIRQNNRPLVITSLGSGGMEVERQVISDLVNEGFKLPIIFIGCDKSVITGRIAKNNLQSLGNSVSIVEVEQIDSTYIENIKRVNDKITVILCRNDIFRLDKYFPNKNIDLIFHSFFKHHLDKNESTHLVQVSQKIAKKVIEYDGYRSIFQMIPQTLVGWINPVFLNAEIFSNLRFQTKAELKKNKNIQFFSMGHYMLEY